VTEVRTAALKLLTLLERHQVHHLAPLLFKHHIRTTQHFIQLQHSDVEDLFDDDILKTLDTEAYLHHTAKQNVLTRMIACQEEEKQYRERQENRKLRRRGRVFRQLNSINTQYKHLGVKSLDVLDQISEAEKDTMFRCMSSEELKAILNLDLEQVKEMKARVIAKFAAAAADGSESSGEEKESPPTAATAAVLRRRTKDRDDSLMADAITRRVLTERFEREEKARKEKASFLATLESFSSESEPLTSRVANGGQDEVRERRPALRLSPHSPSDASSDSSEEPEAVSPESEEERRAHVRAKEEADRVKAEEREAAKKARAEAHSTALNAKIETLPDGMIQAFAQFKRERRATTRKHRNSIKPKKWFEQQEEELTEEEKKKHTKEENLKEVDSDLLMIMTHLSGNTGEDDVEQPGQGEDGPQHEEDEESDVEFDMAAFMSMNPAQKQKRLIEMKLFAAGHSDWKRHDMGDVPVEAKAPPEPEESEEEEDALNKKKKKRNKKKRDIDVFDDYLQHGGSDEFAYEDEANEVFGTASEVRTARVINERKKSIGRALSKSHRYQSMHPEHEVSASDFHRIPGSLEDRTPRGFGYSGGHFFSQGKAPQRDASTSRSSRAGSWGMRGQSKVPIHVKVPRPLSASIQKSVARLAAPKATRQPRVSTLEGSNFQYEPAFVAVYPDELRLRLEGMFAQQGGNSQAGFDTAVHVLDQRLRGNSDGSRGMQSLNEYMQALSDSHASSLRPEHELTPEQFVVVGASPNKQGRARSVDVTAHQDSLDKSQVTLHRSVGGFASQTFATHIPSHQPAAARPASSSTSSRGSATPRSTAFSIDSTSRNKKALEFRRRRTDMIERLFKNTSETIGVTRARAGKIEFSLQTQTNLNAMFDQLVAERERRLTLLLHGKYKYELLREEGPGSESKITDKRFCVVENGLREKAEVAAATYLDTQRSHPSFMSLLFNESSSSLRHLKSMRVQNMTHSNKHRVGSFAPSASPDYIDVLGAKSSMLSNPPLYSPQKQTERSHSVSRPGSAVALQSARLCKSASNKNHALGNLEIQSLEPTLSQGGSLLTGTRKSLKRCASASRMRQAIVPQLTPSGRVQPQPNSRRRRPQSAVTTTDPTQRMLAAAQQQNKTKQQRRRQTAPRPYTASALRRSSSESRLVRNAGEDHQMRRSSSVARTLKRSDSYVVKSIKYRIQRSQSASTTRTASATATAAHLRRMSLGSEYPTALNVGGKQQQHQQRRPQSAMLTRRRSRDSWALLKEKKKQRPGSAVPGTPRHTVKRLLSNEVKHQYGDALSSNKHDWAYARDQHNSTTMLEHSSKIMETEVHMLEANRRMKKSEMISAEAYAAVQMNPNKKKRALVHKHLHTGREIQKTSLSGWNHHDHQPLTASYSSKHHGHMSKLQFLASRPTAMPIAVENSRVESVDHREERLVDAATKHFTGEARPNAELEHRRGRCLHAHVCVCVCGHSFIRVRVRVRVVVVIMFMCALCVSLYRQARAGQRAHEEGKACSGDYTHRQCAGRVIWRCFVNAVHLRAILCAREDGRGGD
jgi:hypothetical protein